MSLPIVTIPTPSLRIPSHEVDPSHIGTPEFQKFLDQLIDTMIIENGVGIAAPQVGRNDRIFVVNEHGKPKVYINPEVTLLGDATIESEEGCLSVPKTWGIVVRAKKVHVKALDRHARHFEFDTRGFLAIVYQHEFDHLEGILFIDKAIKIMQGDGGKTRV